MSNNTKITILLISTFLLIGVYIWIRSTIYVTYKPSYEIEDFYTLPDRKMSVNEYKNVKVTDDEMAKKYFNVYMSTVFSNPIESYGLLEDDYREENYPTYGMYLDYIKNISNDFTTWPLADSYKKENNNYTVIDENGYKYIFVIEAVMKYRVKFSL